MGTRKDFERFVQSRSAFLKQDRAAIKIKANSNKMESDVVSAAEAISKLDHVVIDNPTALVKYRQNITVPAVWLGEQGIRVGNIPQIPVEKIYGLKNYISDNVTRIDGGDLDKQ